MARPRSLSLADLRARARREVEFTSDGREAQRSGGVRRIGPARVEPAKTTLLEVRASLATARYWLPLVTGFLCLVAALFVAAVVAWLLIITAFGLLLDGTTAMWERAGGTGNMSTHRQ